MVFNGTATFLPSSSLAFFLEIPDALLTTQPVPLIPYSTAMSTILIGAFAFTAFTNGVIP